MGLNIGGTGNGKPFCKYNAKTDKWIVRAAGWRESGRSQRPIFAIDFDNITTGWLRFREGEAPERVMDTTLAQRAPLPGEGFKRGFVVMVFSPKYFGGAAEILRHFDAFVERGQRSLHKVHRRPAGQFGMLPVVVCTGSQAMESRHGTNYRPTFAIARWVRATGEFAVTGPAVCLYIARSSHRDRRETLQKRFTRRAEAGHLTDYLYECVRYGVGRARRSYGHSLPAARFGRGLSAGVRSSGARWEAKL